MINYLKLAQEYHGGRNDGFMTDQPVGIKLADDDIVQVTYDVTDDMRCEPRFSRPSRIKYPKAKELIKQYRIEYAKSNARLRLSAERLGRA